MAVVQEDLLVVRAIPEDFLVPLDSKLISNCLKKSKKKKNVKRFVSIFFYLDEFVRDFRTSMFDDLSMVLMVYCSFVRFVPNVFETMSNFEYVQHFQMKAMKPLLDNLLLMFD